MDGVILALDQGTTGSTALVLAEDGEIIGRGYAEITQHYPQPGWVEHDPNELWTVSLGVMTQALGVAGRALEDVRGIGITNQRETTILWDRRTGEPLHRAIVWQSRQTSEICERLKRREVETLVRRKTGLLIDPYFSASKIMWLLERYPDARARARNGQLLFGTVDSWLLWKLTAGSAHATDPTNASRTLLYNIHDHAWDDDLLDLFGVPIEMLPSIRPSCSLFGETASIDGLRPGIPVTGIAGDQQAALYGQACWEPGSAKATYGTGAFVVMNLGQEHPVMTHGLLTTVCCDARGRAAYALEGAIFTAGAAIQWLRDELKIIERAADTERLATAVSDTGGVYFVPAFTGLGVPYWDMHARGAILGLTRGTNRNHLARAVLESIAYQTRDVIEAMRKSGVALTELRVDGGAAANAFLMQFQADVLGVPVDRPAVLDTTATGAALLAGLGVGLWNDPDHLRQLRRQERLFEPQMTPERRGQLCEGWRAAVSRVLTPSREPTRDD